MKIVYLIGGFGNQCFQLAYGGAEADYSTIFLNGAFRKRLKHTDHERVFEPRQKVLHFALLPLLAMDVLFAKMFGKTIFTVLDVKRLKAKPLIALILLGYFQEEQLYSEVPKRAAFWTFQPSDANIIVLHVRGGDILTLPDSENPNGILSMRYYARALEKVLSEDGQIGSVLLQSNDRDYATLVQTYLLERFPDLVIDIATSGLKDMIEGSVGARWFVGSNSTLAFWIVIFRKGIKSILPSPVIKKKDLRTSILYTSIEGEVR